MSACSDMPRVSEEDNTETTLVSRDISKQKLIDSECDRATLESLVNREVYNRLTHGDTLLNQFWHNSVGDGSAQRGSKNLGDRVISFKADRLAFYNKLFSCDSPDKEINQLVTRLKNNSHDRGSFQALYIRLVEQRSEAIVDLFQASDFNSVSDKLLNEALFYLHSRYKDIDQIVDKEALQKSIHENIAQNHESLALLALQTEMADIFDDGTKAPDSSKVELIAALQNIVAKEVSAHVVGNIIKKQNKFQISPLLET